MEEVEKLRKTANGMTELDDAFSSIFAWLYRPEKTPEPANTQTVYLTSGDICFNSALGAT